MGTVTSPGADCDRMGLSQVVRHGAGGNGSAGLGEKGLNCERKAEIALGDKINGTSKYLMITQV